ncbi:RNA repair transcriptional activator RtcR [Polaromonas sp.]|uniref:RNA repair transcriptional activator RtcR n=1 Tax=Polaromonas sp. TaxID=1869339 RepID=UPI0032675FB9
MKKKVVMGFLGTQLDSGLSAARWEKWRPTVSIAQHEDLVVDRLELMHDPRNKVLAERVRDDVIQLSPGTEVRLVEMSLANPWDFGEVYGALYDWMRAYAFDTEREEYWAHITTGTHVAQICLFLLVEARFIPGVLLQTAPPRGRQQGHGIGSYELIDLDLSRYDAINARLAVAQQDAVSFLKSGIATRNPRFNTMIEEIERIAVQSKAPMLLTGPTGAGKSMLARRVFELKKSRHQVSGGFVDVNCATLHGDGAASTLFGHKKGAFTGAASDRPGLLRTADKGVLFLDEIGELGLDEQAMLLKAVEEKRFLPVGADIEVESSFQLIAGTNKDLRAEVARGRFREDLFARINLWTYTLPGLSQRREDIEPNMDHQLMLASEDLGRKTRMTTEARVAYLRFAQSVEAVWTGNFRDLSASITRLATLGDNGRIGVSLVEAEIARLRWQWQETTQETNSPVVSLVELMGSAADALDYFDQLQLQAVIDVCRKSASLSDAGRALFNVSRAQRSVVNDADRLRKYLLKFDLTWEKLST